MSLVRDRGRESQLWYVSVSRRFAARWILWRRRELGCGRLRYAMHGLSVRHVVATFEVNVGTEGWERAIARGLPGGQKFLDSQRDLRAEVEFIS